MLHMMIKFDVGCFLNRPKLLSEYHPNLKGSALFCVDLIWNDRITVSIVSNHNRAYMLCCDWKQSIPFICSVVIGNNRYRYSESNHHQRWNHQCDL